MREGGINEHFAHPLKPLSLECRTFELFKCRIKMVQGLERLPGEDVSSGLSPGGRILGSRRRCRHEQAVQLLDLEVVERIAPAARGPRARPLRIPHESECYRIPSLQ